MKSKRKDWGAALNSPMRVGVRKWRKGLLLSEEERARLAMEEHREDAEKIQALYRYYRLTPDSPHLLIIRLAEEIGIPAFLEATAPGKDARWTVHVRALLIAEMERNGATERRGVNDAARKLAAQPHWSSLVPPQSTQHAQTEANRASALKARYYETKKKHADALKWASVYADAGKFHAAKATMAEWEALVADFITNPAQV
ncbi:MAG: hypothetical protein WDO56_35170 [Gammaproteobacteria bacterium]